MHDTVAFPMKWYFKVWKNLVVLLVKKSIIINY